MPLRGTPDDEQGAWAARRMGAIFIPVAPRRAGTGRDENGMSRRRREALFSGEGIWTSGSRARDWRATSTKIFVVIAARETHGVTVD